MKIEVSKYLKKDYDPRLNNLRKDLLESLNSGIQSVDPYICVNTFFSYKEEELIKENGILHTQKNSLDYSKFKNIYLIAFGKAAIRMSIAIIGRFNISEGLICSNEEVSDIEKKFLNIVDVDILDKDSKKVSSDFIKKIQSNTKNIEYIKGGHPLPDENSIKAGVKITKILEKANNEDLVFILISGGGSALVERPMISFDILKSLTSDLLKKGANIHELNTIRKHLSNIKGGRLIQQSKAKIVSLILSDVPGDPLESIASGPTYHDSTTYDMAFSILKKYELVEKYPEIVNIFNDGIDGKIPETLKEKEYNQKYIDGKIENFLVGSNYICCQNIINNLIEKNYNVIYLGSLIEGNAEEMAKNFSGFLRSIVKDQFGFIEQSKKDKTFVSKSIFSNFPIAIVWGGETTVIVKGNGKGGRNQHFVLSFLSNIIKNINHIDFTKYLFSICSFGTDGIDGASIAAGAIADNWSLEFIKNHNIDIENFLNNSDSFSLFERLNDAIITGPSGTNVTDVGILLVEKM